jgi:hypothetical protein
MKRIKARQLKKDDIALFNEWLYANRDLNTFDPEIFRYESTRILAADDGSEPVMYMPYHLTIVLESLAPNPTASRQQRALAIRELVHEIADTATKLGVGEIWFAGTDQHLIDFAQDHGFEVMNAKVLKAKTSTLCRRK